MNEFIEFAPSGVINHFVENIKSSYPTFFDTQFYLQELEELMTSAREGSFPGSDFVSYSLLKLLPTIAIQKLLSIFKGIL